MTMVIDCYLMILLHGERHEAEKTNMGVKAKLEIQSILIRVHLKYDVHKLTTMECIIGFYSALYLN